ncbi:MAG: hypothetical protein QM523_05380, partial [Candidatus Pacebacteria bacterium]|nr:hypothetical protein [Candidatus Paceibacterota bacterium]
DEYYALKNQCDEIITLPSATAAELASDQEKRNDGYEALGTYLNQNCQILMALWDGVPITARGGSATVVAAKLATGRGAVYHIFTQRQKSSDPDQDRPPQWLYPKDEQRFYAEINQL